MSTENTPHEEVVVIDGLDPAQALETNDYEDPSPEEITDPAHQDYCEPATGIAPIGEDGAE